MATKEEAAANGIVGQTLAIAALRKLVELGHSDVLAQIEDEAKGAIESSVATSQQIDQAVTLKHAKEKLSQFLILARAGASFSG